MCAPTPLTRDGRQPLGDDVELGLLRRSALVSRRRLGCGVHGHALQALLRELLQHRHRLGHASDKPQQQVPMHRPRCNNMPISLMHEIPNQTGQPHTLSSDNP